MPKTTTIVFVHLPGGPAPAGRLTMTSEPRARSRTDNLSVGIGVPVPLNKGSVARSDVGPAFLIPSPGRRPGCRGIAAHEPVRSAGRDGAEYTGCSLHATFGPASGRNRNEALVGRSALHEALKPNQASAPSDRFFIMASKLPQTPSGPCQAPVVAALEYSVARASKKLACSTPDNIDCSQGSGFSFTP